MQRAWRAFAVISIAGVAFFFIFAQSRDLASGTPCVFRSISGVPCVMCGGTRAFFALSQWRLADAWYFNPLVYPVVLMTASICLLWSVEAISGRPMMNGYSVEFARLLSHPISVPMIIIFTFLLWTWRVADAVGHPKPELLREEGIVLKFLRDQRVRNSGSIPDED